MLFTSPRFLVFLVLVLAVLALPKTLRTKKYLLAVASTVFYAAWDVRYVALLLGIGFIDHACAIRIRSATSPAARRLVLALSISSNLAILAYFKYANFFLESLATLGMPSSGPLSILLPAGISFYTFKSMSYTIDVYRGEIEPCANTLDYLTFLTFFPELIAGPIVRASVFLPQMSRDIGLTRGGLRHGLSLLLLGATKKLAVADTLALAIDPVFARPDAYGAAACWLAVIGYAVQIYADFSGYSDMAVGCAKLIGYDLPENFRMPYLSANPSEFWRRWHITLSTWLRDYLYVPLGGNRNGPTRTYANLLATMVLGGLWHGASWNFVAWGTLHGVALAVHRFASRRGLTTHIPNWLAIGMTMTFTTLCWIPFRSTSFETSLQMFVGLMGRVTGFHYVPTRVLWVVAWVVLAHCAGILVERIAEGRAPVARTLFAAFDIAVEKDEISGVYATFGVRTAGGVLLVTIWLGMLYLFATFSSDPFIYFQF